MTYCSFTVGDVEFGFSYGDGLVIPNQYLDRRYLFNYEYTVSLQVAFEVGTRISTLLEVAQVNTPGSQRFVCNRHQLNTLWELSELMMEHGVTLDDGPLTALLSTARATYIEHEAEEIKAAKKTANSGGFVYLLNEVNGDHFKIGRTKNPKDRLRTFGVKLPYRIQFEVIIETDDMYTLERDLHNRFADKRIDGEWFALEADDIAYIKSLAVQS